MDNDKLHGKELSDEDLEQVYGGNMKNKSPGVVHCPQCHEPKLPNKPCPNCGYCE